MVGGGAMKQIRVLGGKSFEVAWKRAWVQSRRKNCGYFSQYNGFIEI